MRRILPLALAGALLCLCGCLNSNRMDVSLETPKKIPLSDFTYILGEDPYPFVGSFRRADDSLIGGGSLIRPTVVLTAGHVVDSDDVDYYYIGGVRHQIDRIVLHEKYKPWEPLDWILYDIAIVFLCEPSEVTPVELAGEQDQVHKGMPLTTVGYGRGFKRHSNPGVFWYYGRLIKEPWEIQMLPTQSTVWFGDSGGALLANGKQIGIISSFSMRQGKIYENSCTSVDYFRQWISTVLLPLG